MATLVHMFKVSSKNVKIYSCNLHKVSICHLHSSTPDGDIRKYRFIPGLMPVHNVNGKYLQSLKLSNNIFNASSLTNYRQYSASGERKSIIDQKYTGFTSEESTKDNEQAKEESKESSKTPMTFLGIALWKWGVVVTSISLMPLLYQLYFIAGGPEIDEDGNVIIDEYSDLHWTQAHFWRMIGFLRQTTKEIQEPSLKKLLPEPLKQPYYQPPYTIVIELVDVLVQPDWTWQSGWRFKKRPGIDYFLEQCAYPRFELVIYTHQTSLTGLPVLEHLDKDKRLSFRLFRDATRYEDGVHKKDIECLNRDPSKIIVIDTDPAAVSLSPRNSILLKKYTGDDDDRTMYDLSALLGVILSSGVDDVRKVLDSYHETGGDIIEEFNKRRSAYLNLQKQKDKTPAPPASQISKFTPSLRR